MAFAAALSGFAAVPQDQGAWQAFITAIGKAHEADVEALRGSRSEDRGPKSILFDAAHRPEKYFDDRDPKATVTFKQWISDQRSMMRRYKKEIGKMLDISADRLVWDDDDFNQELKDEDFTPEQIVSVQEEVYEILKVGTGGDARRIVDAHEDRGLEAWWRLHNRYRPKGLRGATDIAKRIQGIKKPNNAANTYSLLQQLENDVRDFAKASEGEKMPSAIVRSSMLQCVPDNVEKAVRLQLDIDKVEIQTLRDRLEQHARSDNNGPKAMEIGNLGKSREEEEQERIWYEHGRDMGFQPQTWAAPPAPTPPAPAEQPKDNGVWYDGYGNAVIPADKKWNSLD